MNYQELIRDLEISYVLESTCKRVLILIFCLCGLIAMSQQSIEFGERMEVEKGAQVTYVPDRSAIMYQK